MEASPYMAKPLTTFRRKTIAPMRTGQQFVYVDNVLIRKEIS
jgi:hypothetical protein